MFCGKKLRNFLSGGKQNILFYIRFAAKFNTENTSKGRNPFLKKKGSIYREELDSRNSSRVCVTILGNGGVGQPRCIGLFTEFKGYLFNCGENVGRYCREYRVDTWQIRHIFVTQRKWENLSGLIDIYVSNKTYGLYHMSLYGPPGVEDVLAIDSSAIKDTRITKKEGGYIDHTVKIDFIPISSEGKKISSYCDQFAEEESGVVYSYICKIHERPGDFLPEKCIENGVPIGPHLLKLKNWEDIVLPCGKTVYGKDVHGVSFPERILLIVDCPSELFIESFTTEKKFEDYQMPLNTSSLISVFHFTPSHIFKSKKYQDWMRRFNPTTQHFVLNADNPIQASHVIHQTEKYFHLLHPQIFRKLREKELVSKQDKFTNCATDLKITYLPPMLQIYFRPKEEFLWCNVVKEDDDLNVTVKGDDIVKHSVELYVYKMCNVVKEDDDLNVTVEGDDIVKHSVEFFDKLYGLKSALVKKSLANVDGEIYPEVLFFGTSSSLSTAYRNVTAILVNTSPDNTILLDCGEGTMMQFVRYFGSDVYSALRNISCIFISHRHIDHYLGMFEIISQRIKAFQQAGIPYKPVALILPYLIKDIVLKFSEAFQNIRPAVKIFICKKHAQKKEILKQFIGNIELYTVPVKHCTDAWGVVIESESDWKIVYSGDSAPCQTLVDAGENCTLLIHEASMLDDMHIEAFSKNHSTPSQVIDIAEKMNAQYTILTHFSKRYYAFPIIPDCKNREVACAFDFMKIRRCDLPILSLFTPVIKSLFEDQQEKFSEQASLATSFENVFLKVLKS